MQLRSGKLFSSSRKEQETASLHNTNEKQRSDGNQSDHVEDHVVEQGRNCNQHQHEEEHVVDQEKVGQETNHDEDQEEVTVTDEFQIVNDLLRFKRRGRGISTNISFKCKDGQARHVDWNEEGQAIGEGGRLLRRALAWYAKQPHLWPLDKKWSDMPEISFIDTWKLLKEDFVVDGHESFCFKMIHSRHISWREYVKRVWKAEKGDIEKVLQKLGSDTRVDRDQLKRLIAKWEDPAEQAKSRVNKMNRASKILNHRSGARAIAEIREDLRKKHQREATMLDVMRILYPSETLVDDIEQVINESQENHDDYEGSQSRQLSEQAAYQKIMQSVSNNYIRNVGIGHDMSSRRPVSLLIQETKGHDVKKEVCELKEQVKELKEQMAQYQQLMLMLNMCSQWQQVNGNVHQVPTSGSETVGGATRSANFPQTFPPQLPSNPYLFYPQMPFPQQGVGWPNMFSHFQSLQDPPARPPSETSQSRQPPPQ